MKDVEIFTLLNKILSKVEHIENRLAGLENKFGPTISNIENKNTVKQSGVKPNIKDEIEKIRQKHLNSLKTTAMPDLTGVPGLPMGMSAVPGGIVGLPDVAGLTNMIKGLALTKDEDREVIEAKSEEVKDEESNK